MTTYTVYQSDDSSIFESGLSHDEAIKIADDAWKASPGRRETPMTVVTDEQFAADNARLAAEARFDKAGLSPIGFDLCAKLWAEQLAAGYGDPGEIVTDNGLAFWISNRVMHPEDIEAAAHGDIAHLIALRTECGLSPL